MLPLLEPPVIRKAQIEAAIKGVCERSEIRIRGKCDGGCFGARVANNRQVRGSVIPQSVAHEIDEEAVIPQAELGPNGAVPEIARGITASSSISCATDCGM